MGTRRSKIYLRVSYSIYHVEWAQRTRLYTRRSILYFQVPTYWSVYYTTYSILNCKFILSVEWVLFAVIKISLVCSVIFLVCSVVYFVPSGPPCILVHGCRTSVGTLLIYIFTNLNLKFYYYDNEQKYLQNKNLDLFFSKTVYKTGSICAGM